MTNNKNKLENVQITKMTKQDLPEIWELEKKCFPIPWSLASFEEELQNTLATFLVAKISSSEQGIMTEKIIGYIGMWFVLDECQIINLAVDPIYQKHGVATALLSELFKQCTRNKTTYVTLEVRATNLPAQKLYAKFGFKEETFRKNYYKNPDGTREDAIIMSLYLS